MMKPVNLVAVPFLVDEPVTRGDIARVMAKLELIEKRLPPPARRGLNDETKRHHVRTIERFFGGRCPCCGDAKVYETGITFGEYDHFTDNRSKHGPHETWLICVACHNGFSRGLRRRDEARTPFDYYQWRRGQANCELPGL